ncbi:MAG: hypothetical protein Q4C71_05740 [Microbacteriaceae bacterium]|nr:hypothetical protein [Microbacteriaceae bacterium]
MPKDWPKDLPLLRDKELNHILYGDKKGGGHLYGHGWVHSRNEFNESLKAAHIIEALKNNALPLEQLKAEFEKDDKTSIKREATYNGVDFYIVYSLKTDKQTREAIYKIITAYPKK